MARKSRAFLSAPSSGNASPQLISLVSGLTTPVYIEYFNARAVWRNSLLTCKTKAAPYKHQEFYKQGTLYVPYGLDIDISIYSSLTAADA